jgi:1,3-beta-glucan synthase component
VNDAEPTSPEARRRLSFFVNSLFMDMPRAPPVASMMSWSCMTPYYRCTTYNKKHFHMTVSFCELSMLDDASCSMANAVYDTYTRSFCCYYATTVRMYCMVDVI